MSSRGTWIGLGVGAALGAIIRIAVTTMHFPDLFTQPYVGLYVAFIGAVVGGLAGMTGTALRGALAGAVLSVLAYAAVLGLAALFALLGAAGAGEPVPLPSLWEVLVIGAIPGGIAGWVAQSATKRSKAHLAAPAK